MSDKRKTGRRNTPTLEERVLKRYQQIKKSFGHPSPARVSLQLRLAREFQIPCQQILDIVDPDRAKLERRNRNYQEGLASQARWDVFSQERQTKLEERKMAEAAEQEKHRENPFTEVADTIRAVTDLLGDRGDLVSVSWAAPHTAIAVLGGEGGYCAIQYRLNDGEWETKRLSYHDAQKQRDADRKGQRRLAHNAGAAAVEAWPSYPVSKARAEELYVEAFLVELAKRKAADRKEAFTIFADGWRILCPNDDDDTIRTTFDEWYPA